MPAYIGIDPGASGGISLVSGSEVRAFKMPSTQKDIWDLILFLNVPGAVFAMIEKVNTGFPGTSKSAMAKLYGNYKEMTMALTAVKIPFEEITSQSWQKYMNITGDKTNRTKWKNVLKTKAQQMFPGVKVTLDTADSLIIAEFCRLVREGRIQRK